MRSKKKHLYVTNPTVSAGRCQRVGDRQGQRVDRQHHLVARMAAVVAAEVAVVEATKKTARQYS